MSLVHLRISSQAFRFALRLPEGTTIAGLATRPDLMPQPAGEIVVVLDMPDAPEGAAYCDPVYTRQAGLPDPVTLTGMRWFRADGSEIKQETGAETG